MSTNKRYEGLIKLLKEWLNEEDDYDLKFHEEEMRDRSKKIRSCLAPKMNITKKPEIDRILEEAEAHMPKKVKYTTRIPGENIELSTERPVKSDFISSCNKERIVSLLWEAYEANLESLKALVGEDTRLKIAKERVCSCLEDWRTENAMD